MDREIYDEEVDRIAEEIRRLSLDRHWLYEREQQLIRRLDEARRRRDSRARRQRASSPKERVYINEAVCSIDNTECGSRKVDRFGNKLEVGDRVELLTPGRYMGKVWKVYKLTEKRVLCERNGGAYKTNREYRNVRKV